MKKRLSKEQWDEIQRKRFQVVTPAIRELIDAVYIEEDIPPGCPFRPGRYWTRRELLEREADELDRQLDARIKD